MSEEATIPVPTPPPASATCVATSEVLFQEYQLIWGEDETTRSPEVYYAKANAAGQAALCLSGGGVRSAAFSLGVIQALGRRRLLTGFHYLSTVSGGGYVGGWLQRWIHECGGNAAEVMAKLAAYHEPVEVKALRPDSAVGALGTQAGSTDRWHTIAIFVRNFVVTWLLLGPFLMLVALVPHLFLEGVEAVRLAVYWHVGVLHALLGLTALSIAWATAAVVRLLPSYRDPSRLAGWARHVTGDELLNRRIIYPLVLWAIFATLALAAELLNPSPLLRAARPFVLWPHGVDIVFFSLGGMVGGLVVAAIGLRGQHAKTFHRNYIVWPFAVVMAMLAAWGSVEFLFRVRPDPFAFLMRVLNGFGSLTGLLPSSIEESGTGAALGREAWLPALVVLAPFLLMGSQFFGGVVFAAFRATDPAQGRPVEDREWLNRLGALQMKTMLSWVFVGFCALLLNVGMERVANAPDLGMLFVVVLASGAIAILPTGREVQSSLSGIVQLVTRVLPLSVVTTLAAFTFLAVTLLIAARIAETLADRAAKYVSFGLEVPYYLDVQVAVDILLIAGLFIVIFLVARRIPANRFTLTGLHRDRLTRSFLGAARPGRAGDPFTDFDSADNVRLHSLNSRDGSGRTVLYPVFNASLDLAVSQRWDERRSEPFIFSPAYSGSSALRREGKPLSRRTGAYVPSLAFAGEGRDVAMSGTGVSLATAMAISGAAAGPRIDYASSPARNLVMILLSLRLGAWLPNPACAARLRKAISRSDTGNALRAVVREVTGAVDDTGPEVHLSDGGHFDNLGLYEMVRRRCRYIVVSDGSLDPDLAFADLANAIRKAKIDLDVDIWMGPLEADAREGAEPPPQFAWALGEIQYPEFECRGSILYIKASLIGSNLPIEAASYAAVSRTFPHESTSDQSVTEAQFESYRRLGESVVESIGKPGGSYPTIAAFLDEARRAAQGGKSIVTRLADTPNERRQPAERAR